MAYFVGTHERQLDDKGRLALPVSFRTHLGERCYLVHGENNCVRVVRAEDFEAMADELKERVKRGEVSKQYQRVIAANASPAEFDRQGRVKVDDKLRQYAGLMPESKVFVIGNLDDIEIWSPERFERVTELGTTEIAGTL